MAGGGGHLLGQLVGEPPLPGGQSRILQRQADVGREHGQPAPLVGSNVAGAFDGQRADHAAAAAQRRDKAAVERPTPAPVGDEQRSTAGQHVSDRRAPCDAGAAGHHQARAVVHSQADGGVEARLQTRAQARHGEVERRIAVDRPLDGGEGLVARALPPDAAGQRRAEDADAEQQREREQSLEDRWRGAVALEGGQHERRVEQQRGQRRQQAAAAVSKRGPDHRDVIGVAPERGGVGARVRDGQGDRGQRQRDGDRHGPPQRGASSR